MRTLVYAVLLAALVAAALAACTTMNNQSASSRAPDDHRMDWWREARFGMFIHWGLYAIPAGKWAEGTDHAEWIRTTAKIPRPEYDKLVDQFNPVDFDADRWVSVARDAGCRYIVITTKHHDGFCLFDSRYTDFDIMSTPFKRDIMKELSEATRKQGLRQCWYHSIMDWHHQDYLPRREWENDRPTEGADFDRYNQYLKNQVTELLTNYGPIGVMWFDGEWEPTWTKARGDDLYRLCRRLQPDVIVNNRVGKTRDDMAGLTRAGEQPAGDFGTPEQEIPAIGLPGADWETCMTMNDHWGYNAYDKNFKSTEDLIRKLCDIASKGGNFLLNVGPTAKGEIPPESVERLHQMGRWMGVNGEAIYGTAAGPFGTLPWGRCTAKMVGGNTTLYLMVFDWPTDGKLLVEGLATDPDSATLLADTRAALVVSREGSAVRINLPLSAPDPICSVVAMRMKGRPVVYRPPDIAAAADIFIQPARVSMSDPSGGPAVLRYSTDGADPTSASPVFSRPFRINGTTTIKARLFIDNKPVSGVAARRLERVAPIPGVITRPAEPGLVCSVYKGDWNKLPDFGALTPEGTTTIDEIGLTKEKEELTGRRFTGLIRVPTDDVYQFALTSDDGARLVIDGKTIADNDGLHIATEKTGLAPLAKGWHAITVDWFNKAGEAALSLKCAQAGQKLVPVKASMLGH